MVGFVWELKWLYVLPFLDWSIVWIILYKVSFIWCMHLWRGKPTLAGVILKFMSPVWKWVQFCVDVWFSACLDVILPSQAIHPNFRKEPFKLRCIWNRLMLNFKTKLWWLIINQKVCFEITLYNFTFFGDNSTQNSIHCFVLKFKVM